MGITLHTTHQLVTLAQRGTIALHQVRRHITHVPMVLMLLVRKVSAPFVPQVTNVQAPPTQLRPHVPRGRTQLVANMNALHAQLAIAAALVVVLSDLALMVNIPLRATLIATAALLDTTALQRHKHYKLHVPRELTPLVVNTYAPIALLGFIALQLLQAPNKLVVAARLVSALKAAALLAPLAMHVPRLARH